MSLPPQLMRSMPVSLLNMKLWTGRSYAPGSTVSNLVCDNNGNGSTMSINVRTSPNPPASPASPARALGLTDDAGPDPIDRARSGDPAAAFGPSRRLGVAELAGELGLPKGTVHGILRTLQFVGFVEQDRDSGKYQLGAALLHMGSSYLDGNELRTRALNWADALATQSGESVRIGTLHENQVLIVHHVFRPDDSRQALDVGTLVPAHATALGKALLAGHRYLAPAVVAAGLMSYTPATVTDIYRLARELDASEHRGGRARSASSFATRLDRSADHRSPRRDRRRDWNHRPGRRLLAARSRAGS